MDKHIEYTYRAFLPNDPELLKRIQMYKQDQANNRIKLLWYLEYLTRNQKSDISDNIIYCDKVIERFLYEK